MELTQDEAQELSRLLFEAREEIAMWGDVIERRIGQRDPSADRLRAELDAYRARCGWDPGGFGSEWVLSSATPGTPGPRPVSRSGAGQAGRDSG